MCDFAFNNDYQLRRHQRTRLHFLKDLEMSKGSEESGYIVLLGKSAFKNRIATVIFLNKDLEFTINEFCEKIKNSFFKCLNSYLQNSASIKISGEENLFNLYTFSVTFFQNDEIVDKIENKISPQFISQNDELNRGGGDLVGYIIQHPN